MKRADESVGVVLTFTYCHSEIGGVSESVYRIVDAILYDVVVLVYIVKAVRDFCRLYTDCVKVNMIVV